MLAPTVKDAGIIISGDPVNDKIEKLISEIEQLRRELHKALSEQDILDRVEGTRIDLEKKLRQTQQQLKENLYSWLRASQPRNVVSAPFIYAMIVPMVFFDLALTLYQHICFRLYRIPRVRRANHMVFDRQHLSYLNIIQKINCTYCAYGNGLLSYGREISAQTELYWCPIKHARKIVDPHSGYAYFAAYGSAEEYQGKQKVLRETLSKGDIPIIDIDST